VNQFVFMLLSMNQVVLSTLPRCARHLLAWVVSVVSFSKLLNPMVFMTKEYFLGKVHEEEMFIV
jgi:hypothetical protein